MKFYLAGLDHSSLQRKSPSDSHTGVSMTNNAQNICLIDPPGLNMANNE